MAILAGIIGGISPVFLKLGAFSMWVPALIAEIASFVMFFKALSKGKTVIVAPLMGVSNTLTTIIAGKFLFSETLSSVQMVGILLLVVGSVILSAKK